jgi:3-oxoacyl-[acyl-carrier protein] reductase
MGEAGGTAVVTGAAQGIGAAIARRLAADGWRVAVLDVDDAGAAAVAEEIGGRAVHCNVADPASVRAAAAAVGPARVLVNNAGVWFTRSMLGSTDQNLSDVVAVNLLGVVHCCRAFAPAMIAGGSGSIVNVSSGASKSASPGYGVYPATKSAVETLTRQLAIEWGPSGVRVNCVGPGAIQTENNGANFQGERLEARSARIPLRRTGRPADVADVVSVLCGDDMRYVTGQVIYVDGGLGSGVAGV